MFVYTCISGRIYIISIIHNIHMYIFYLICITHTQRQKDRQTDRQTERQTDRKTDRQTGRQKDRQIDRQTERQTFTYTTFPE